MARKLAVSIDAAGKAVIVDELGRIDERLDALKPLEKRRDELRALVISWHLNDDPASPFSHEGKFFSIDVSACANERVIASMPKLFKRLGEKLFLSLCKFSLANLDKHVAIVEQGPYVTTSQTGARRVKSTPKVEPLQAA